MRASTDAASSFWLEALGADAAGAAEAAGLETAAGAALAAMARYLAISSSADMPVFTGEGAAAGVYDAEGVEGDEPPIALMRASTDAASSLLLEVEALGADAAGAAAAGVYDAAGAEGDEPPMAAMRAITDAASSFWLEALGADAAGAAEAAGLETAAGAALAAMARYLAISSSADMPLFKGEGAAAGVYDAEG